MGRVPQPERIRKLPRAKATDVSDHGVFRVRELTYPSIARPVYTFDCPDWCTVIAETTTGEVVLVWQYRFGTDELTLETPGGVIDAGEAPEDSARRELAEETGYEAASLELLLTIEPNPALQGNRCFVYLGRGAALTQKTAFDELEDLEIILVPRKRLPALLDSGQITHAIVVAALETYLRRSR